MKKTSQTPNEQIRNELELKKETIRRLLDSKNELDEKSVVELLDSDPVLRKAVISEMIFAYPDFASVYVKKHNLQIPDDDIDIEEVVRKGETRIREEKSKH